MWFIFALLSAVFASARKASEKQLSHQLNHFTTGWTIQLFALPLLLVALLISGELYNPLQLGADFWIPTVIVWLGFYPLSVYLYFNALKHGELSKTIPLQSLGPVMALGLAWLLLGEQPSLAAFIGIATVMAGVYMLNVKDSWRHNPLKIFTADKANLYTLCNLLLISLVAVLDKMAIDASGPVYFSFVSTVGAVVVLYATALIFKVRELHLVRRHFKSLNIAGTLFGGGYLLYLLAIAQAPLAYVAASGAAAMLLSMELDGRVALLHGRYSRKS